MSKPRRLDLWASVRGGWKHTVHGCASEQEARANVERIEKLIDRSGGHPPPMRVVGLVELRPGEKIIKVASPTTLAAIRSGQPASGPPRGTVPKTVLPERGGKR